MKKLFLGIAAMTLVVPSMASAGTAAQALSVKSAAVEPVRAAAQPGETKALPALLIIVGLVAVLGGLIWVVADSN